MAISARPARRRRGSAGQQWQAPAASKTTWTTRSRSDDRAHSRVTSGRLIGRERPVTPTLLVESTVAVTSVSPLGLLVSMLLAGYATVAVMMVAMRPLLLLQRGEGLLCAIEIVRIQRVADLLKCLRKRIAALRRRR